MPSTYVFTATPYAKEEIPLASLIPDRRYPNQDAIKDTVTEECFSVNTDKNFSGLIRGGSHSVLQGFITTLCSIFWNDEAEDNFQVSADEARIYSLDQPRAVFERLCSSEEVRKWLQECYREREQPLLVVGYRTLLNAKLVRKDQNSLTVSGSAQACTATTASGVLDGGTGVGLGVGHEGGSGGTVEFEAHGERIFAICYRSVTFKFHRNGVKTLLDRKNCWETFSKTRGQASESAEVIEADIETKDYSGEEGDEVHKVEEDFYVLLAKEDEE